MFSIPDEVSAISIYQSDTILFVVNKDKIQHITFQNPNSFYLKKLTILKFAQIIIFSQWKKTKSSLSSGSAR